MLFGRRKPGFFAEGEEKPLEPTEETPQEETAESPQVEEKPDLMEVLESMEDIPDEEIPPAMLAAIEQDRIEAEKLAAEPPVELTPGELLADFIRRYSANAELVSYAELKKDDPDIDAHLKEIEEHTELGDIMRIKGQKGTYFYSNNSMTDNYAMIAALVVEKDLAHTVAEMTRWNAKTYPAPTPMDYFTRHPYYMTIPQLERVRKELQMDEKYSDIGEVITGNNKVYFHADPPMSKRYATALAEDTEQGEYGYR